MGSLGPSFGLTYKSPIPCAASPRELEFLSVPHWISSLLSQNTGEDAVTAASSLAILSQIITLHAIFKQPGGARIL